MFKYYFRSFFIFLTVLPFLAGAQNAAHSVEVNLQQSINIFSANQNPLQGNAFGTEAIFHYNVNRVKQAWASDLGVKSIDAIFNYKNMQNITRVNLPIAGEFGDTYGLLGGLTFEVFNIKDKVYLDFTPALGFVYASESWFSNKNPLVGSKLNFGLKAGLNLNAPVSKKVVAGLNLDVLHYSNGGTRVPNNGMNVVGAGLNLKYILDDNNISNSKTEELKIDKKHTFDLGVNVGRRGAYQSRKGLYRTALYGGYNYRLKSYLSLGAGLDAVYYHTVYDPSRNTETYQSSASSFKKWRLGAAIGPDLWMGNLAVMAKYGYYIYYDSLKPITTYWTAGGKYKLNNWVALQAKLYLHETEADFVGFGVIFTK